jgi:hypothetical protein
MSVLAPHVDGWRSDDGYHLRIRRGAHSRRPIGELVSPDGTTHLVAGNRRDTAQALLERAEEAVRAHRLSGRVG